MALVELILRVREDMNWNLEEARLTKLLGGYAIAVLEEDGVENFLKHPEILYAELPARVFQTVEYGRAASCIRNRPTAVTLPDTLSGKGVLVGIVDSGIDYTHPDFRNEDGTTRIVALWDQSYESSYPPEGYALGTLFSKEQINLALREALRAEQRRVVPSVDLSGHGTHVAGIAAGNGRASDGQYRGVAFDSELLVVKLEEVRSGSSMVSGTARLMEAVDFCIRFAMERNQPLALNLSYGTSEGAHNGQSLLETYLDTVSAMAKCVICVGTGNEGVGKRHAGGRLATQAALQRRSESSREAYESGRVSENRRGNESRQREYEGESSIGDAKAAEIELAIGGQERSVELELWKSYVDDFSIELTAPNGEKEVFDYGRGEPIEAYGSAFLYAATGRTVRFGSTKVEVLWSAPNIYQNLSEVRIEITAERGQLGAGVWKIRLIPEKIVDGAWDLWILRGLESSESGFVTPDSFRTLTIPSTASKVISVGAYDFGTLQTAAFSGRGTAREAGRMKPDLVAPGVDIISCAVSGGYTARSGTSMATPFVTGGAALLLQWGIVDGNDPYLYGEKLREYLLKGAVRLPAEQYPNPVDGWGRLCVNDSLPE